MKPSAFTVLHNDVLEGRWRRSNGAWVQNTELSLSLSLSLCSLGRNSAASYLTLRDWNTSSTRLQRAVWWYLYVCLCQRNTGTERQNTVTVWARRRVSVFLQFLGWLHSMHLCLCMCVFCNWEDSSVCLSTVFTQPAASSRLFRSVMASDAFHYLFTKVIEKVFSTCYLPKVALF